MRQREGHRRVLRVLVVDVDQLARHVGRVRHPERPVVLDRHAALSLRPERDRLPLLQPDLVLQAMRFLAQQVERPVVEDVAVLIDLDERGAVVGGGRPQDAGEVLAVVVQGPGNE